MRRFLPLLAVALLGIGAADPRPGWIDQQLAGQFDEILLEIDGGRAVEGSAYEVTGIDYLRGHLLEKLHRTADSPAAFTAAMTSAPELAPYSRYRLALDRFRADQPTAAAGLLATLLANEPPPALTPSAVRWLTLALLDGDNCQLVSRWQDWNLAAPQVRELQAALIECRDELADETLGPDQLRAILARKRTDETARRAAQALAGEGIDTLDPTTQLLVGLTFVHHREFDRALPALVAALESSEQATPGVRGVDRADVLYALARCHYWLEQYGSAAQSFTQAALEETDDGKTARALFQKGRSLALAGDWDAAVESYRQAADAAPTDSWAAAALLSGMRLEWRQGREEPALELLGRLRSRRSWRISIERAAIFLAVSDLVRGRADRAGNWLDIARQARRRDGPEIWYWRGRLAELQQLPEVAIARYLELLADDAFHPLAAAARQRLTGAALAAPTAERAASLARSDRASDWLRSWLLQETDSPTARELEAKLRARWRRSSRLRPYLELEPTPAADWRLWRGRLRSPEETLLALGIVEVPSTAGRRLFPLDDNGLALARSRLLAANDHHRGSLYAAEVLDDRVPRTLPFQFLPQTLQQRLYPRPYGFLVEQQARRFGVDPNLLSAVIREESRYDPMAVSAAAARGLTQFVVPTARRLADKLGFEDHDPVDLHRPQVAITLGAAYLAELAALLDGRAEQMVAAYNAGEPLARLWQAFCFSREPEEYYSKVGFRQTRGYLEKVLTSRAHYAAATPASDRP